jgi:FkbM family methyltransferase
MAAGCSVEVSVIEKDLIYDVGLHNGDDTAYYLSKGYRVVAIEADPTLVEQAHVRFDNEIKRGRLTLLNAGIGPQVGLAQFWICDEWSEWNSFDKAVASRMGKKHHTIDVYCRQFNDVLREHGTPYYLKVDIENYDHYCIEGIDPKEAPQYVSLEFGRFEDLITLHRLGYNAFKLIHQAGTFGHAQFRARPVDSIKELLKIRLNPHLQLYKLGGSLASLKSRIAELLLRGRRPRGSGPTRPPSGGDVRPGPSGPFGEETDGQWDSFEETSYHLLSFLLGRSQHGNPPDWNIWFDIHATKRSAA